MTLLPKCRPERESTLKAHGFSRGLAYIDYPLIDFGDADSASMSA